ncbi:MAG TPA: hypothetical protein P5180_06315 [Bacteroidales bacterium]|nr:hypothetical protein [Bacteroidales bacterium]HRW85029.1 hypothetical protein [Bacteroidales bacterium]
MAGNFLHHFETIFSKIVMIPSAPYPVRIWVSVILIALPFAGYSQIPDDSPVIRKKDLPEATFINTRIFTGESLFGYMNGGAELYREYGIADAVIAEFEVEGRYLKCEVFRMTGPEEAFGIYSVSKFRCSEITSLPGYSCQTPYHLQICKGSYYISIINRSGSPADSLLSLSLGKIVADRIIENPADINTFLPATDIADIRRNGIIVRGKLGLANGAPEWEDYFSDLKDYVALILPMEDKTLISVRFNSGTEMDHFLNLHEWVIENKGTIKTSRGEKVSLHNKNHLIITIPS